MGGPIYTRKIHKLIKNPGLRLVYHYEGKNLLVIAVGKRERNVVYEAARARLEGKL